VWRKGGGEKKDNSAVRKLTEKPVASATAEKQRQGSYSRNWEPRTNWGTSKNSKADPNRDRPKHAQHNALNRDRATRLLGATVKNKTTRIKTEPRREQEG